MKIFICSSKHLYHTIPPIKEQLEKQGHKITLPNSYEEPLKEEEIKKQGSEVHAEWKAMMFKLQEKKILENDAVLVINFEKKGQPNYIGGATFLEIFKAFELGKKIYLYNPVPENVFTDELVAMKPVVINGDISRIN